MPENNLPAQTVKAEPVEVKAVPVKHDTADIVSLPRNSLAKIKEQYGDVPPEALALLYRRSVINSMLGKILIEGTHYADYAKLTGKSSWGAKKVLLKPGADAICSFFEFSPSFVISREDLGGGHRSFEITCALHSKFGDKLSEGIGSCNTRENRFGSATPFNGYNTALKMAKKRAIVDAVITNTACSDLFTQDIEDMDKSAFGPAPARQPVKGQSRPPVNANAYKDATDVIARMLAVDIRHVEPFIQWTADLAKKPKIDIVTAFQEDINKLTKYWEDYFSAVNPKLDSLAPDPVKAVQDPEITEVQAEPVEPENGQAAEGESNV
jgi:hypothetical protein